MNEKLTDWFPAKVKPVRAGVYETRSEGRMASFYQYWTGKHWGYWSISPERAAATGSLKSGLQAREWRGLAADPGAKP